MLNILCIKGTKFVLRCWGLLLEDFRAMAKSFKKVPKKQILISNICLKGLLHGMGN